MRCRAEQTRRGAGRLAASWLRQAAAAAAAAARRQVAARLHRCELRCAAAAALHQLTAAAWLAAPALRRCTAPTLPACQRPAALSWRTTLVLRRRLAAALWPQLAAPQAALLLLLLRQPLVHGQLAYLLRRELTRRRRFACTNWFRRTCARRNLRGVAVGVGVRRTLTHCDKRRNLTWRWGTYRDYA